ncbi:unnamed protein product [Citrullus colocynthis]|uniref:Uncharacterized protein n=1 Tax=Citrullus colocynthis TaxID=252529 RepID=A0ABP0YQS7_9ROSI
METPSSIRRITRSQTLAATNSVNNSNSSISRKIEECDNNDLSKSRQRNRKSQDLAGAKGQDRSALIDITNDSPIVGLAAGNLMTPISSVTKQRSCRPNMMTPGSGEALLRGQVKTLLQKVEEEAEISKLSLESRPFVHLQSPAGLLAPTPANTPQILNMSQDGNLCNVTTHPIVEEQMISQVVVDIDLFNGKEEEESQINRSLLLDFSEKSETIDDEAIASDCSSVLAHQDTSSLSLSPSEDDDSSSLWSIQVNASSHGEDEEDEDVEEEEVVIEDEEEEKEEEDDEYDNGLVDELCKGLSKISVNEKGEAHEFTGKHTRFVYDSEDEMFEEVSDESHGGVSPSVLRLKGMPTPKGKHLRFRSEDE